MIDVAHLLRPGHLQQLRNILDDPEASDNDRFVALELLKNANIAASGVLPGCQDTGTATVIGYKGENVFTFGDDEEALSRGVYDAYAQKNLRYSQMAPDRHVHREEHRLEPAGAGRPVRGAGRRLQVHVPGQGRRLGQQDVPVPGDQGAAEPGVAAEVRGRQGARHRHLAPARPTTWRW